MFLFQTLEFFFHFFRILNLHHFRVLILLKYVESTNIVLGEKRRDIVSVVHSARCMVPDF